MSIWKTMAKVGGAVVGGPIGFFAADALTGGDIAKKIAGATGMGSVKGPQQTYVGGSQQASADQLARTGNMATGMGMQAGSAFGQQQAEQLRQLQVREQQQALAAALAQQAAGQGPSVAGAQLQGAMDANARQAMALAAGARGNTALAQRNAMNAASQANLQAGAQAAALKAQEQMSAQQQLAGVLGQTRGMDMEGRGMYGQQGMGLQGQMLSAEELRQQQLMGQAQLDSDYQLAAYQGRLANQQGKRQLFGTLVQTGGQMLMAASDERVKENVSSAGKDIAALLGHIKPKSYDYKDPDKHGAGRKFGLMAQDLEKSEMGRAMVREVGGVKHVDVAQAALGALASNAELARRIAKLEKKGGR